MWSDPDILKIHLCSCTYYNDDGLLSGRNVSLIAMQLNYISTSRCIWWSFKKIVKPIKARNMKHVKQKKNKFI